MDPSQGGLALTGILAKSMPPSPPLLVLAQLTQLLLKLFSRTIATFSQSSNTVQYNNNHETSDYGFPSLLRVFACITAQKP